MQKERRTLSVPTISYEDVDRHQDHEMAQHHGTIGTPPPSAHAAGGAGAYSAASGWPPLSHPGQGPHVGHSNQMASLARPAPHMARSRSASTSSLSTPAGQPPNPQKKKIVIACQRCRTRKIRCDGALPACRSCVKAGAQCIEVDRSGDNNLPRSHVLDLENRIKWLEGIVRSRCPDLSLADGPSVELRSRPPAIRIVTTGPDFNQPQQPISTTSSPIFALSPASTCATPVSFDFSSPGVSPGYLQPMSPLTFSDVSPSPTPSPGPSSPLLLPRDTLPHEAGLLALSASDEPKYVGPSSGICFARMVFADSTASLGPDFPKFGHDLRDAEERKPTTGLEPIQIPAMDVCAQLSKVYFETVHLQYPFLHQPTFEGCLQAVCRGEPAARLPPGHSTTTAHFHILLVLSIGAHIVSTRTGGRPGGYNSDGYYAAALRLSDVVALTGTLQAAQSSLLLAMRSLYVAEGWNLWYLNAITMATCTELGLHRRLHDLGGGGGQGSGSSKAALKRRVFWCAYSLDRSLGIALGRPFTIRDDSLDAELPHDTDNDEELSNLALGTHSPIAQSIEASRHMFGCSIFIFRILKILSNITATIYRASPSGPGGSDLSDWQSTTYQQLFQLQSEIRSSLGPARRVSGSDPAQYAGNQLAELKIHEAIQLLYRPNQLLPRPSLFALQQCFRSAVETIRIYARPKRYNEPPYPYTRLTEHSIFLAGITMLYCHRTCREVRETAANDFLSEEIRSCSMLLGDLAQFWPTAQKSRARFDLLAQSTLAFASATASARMLSPHCGPRRCSTSSARPFADSITLEVPSIGSPSLASSPSWYDAMDARPGAGQSIGIGGWAVSQAPPTAHPSWGELQLTSEDMMISGMEGVQPVADMDLLDMMGNDPVMWGIDSQQQQQQQQQQQEQQQQQQQLQR